MDNQFSVEKKIGWLTESSCYQVHKGNQMWCSVLEAHNIIGPLSSFEHHQCHATVWKCREMLDNTEFPLHWKKPLLHEVLVRKVIWGAEHAMAHTECMSYLRDYRPRCCRELFPGTFLKQCIVPQHVPILSGHPYTQTIAAVGNTLRLSSTC